jgi:hypothetical protein
MFEPPVETVFLWAGIAAVGVVVFATITQLPTTAPPDATAAAATVDEVATSPPGSLQQRPLGAQFWSPGSRQLGLRNDGGTTHATFLQPVTPALRGPLQAVLDGTPPAAVFSSPSAFGRAATRARQRAANGSWRPAPNRLTVRRTVWRDIDVTLVG